MRPSLYRIVKLRVLMWMIRKLDDRAERLTASALANASRDLPHRFFREAVGF
jgi:hypothetical protein